MTTISVITATYNCVQTVQDCINSVASQSWRQREHILVDGASTDGTLEVLQRNAEKLSALISEKDSGIYDALNKGISIARGDVIGFLHADDVFASSEILTKIAERFEDPRVSAIFGDLQYVKRSDTNDVVRYWKSSSFYRPSLEWGWMPPHPTLYVRREWYQQIGGFDTDYRIAADYLSILRLFSSSGFTAKHIPEVLVKMRLGGVSNKSLRNVIQKTREDLRALRHCRIGAWGGYGALVWKNLGKLRQFSWV